MAKLHNLPDELLLAVAGHLDTSNLLSLARTSNRFRPIAQEVLFRSPTVPRSPNEYRSPSVCLLRTLLQRPDLAKLVKKLDLSPSVRYVEANANISFDTGGQPTLTAREQGFNVAMREPEITAAIIELAPNLLDLSIKPCDCFFHGRNHEREPCHSPEAFLPKMFHSRPNSSSNVNISALQPFQNLKSLRVESLVFEHQWLSLPNLESLSLGAATNAFWSADNPLPTMPKISRLELNLDFSALLPDSALTGDHLRILQLDKFLSIFSKLVQLQISFHEVLQSHSWSYSFSNIISRISSVESTLEILDLGPAPAYKDQWHSIDTGLSLPLPCSPLAAFSKLRILTAPQFSLPIPVTLPDLGAPFPNTLEVLEVHQVDYEILEWIKHIVANRTQLPSLRRIDLCLSESQQADLEDLKAQYKRYCYMQQLPRVGVELSIWWEGKDHVPMWKMEQHEWLTRCTTRLIKEMKELGMNLIGL